MLLKIPARDKLTRELDGESENITKWKDKCSVYLKLLQEPWEKKKKKGMKY